jgi:integrase/recombinase XerC
VAVIGEGKSEKIYMRLIAPTAALADWVAVREEWPGPLFVHFDRAAGPPGHLSRLDAGNAARASKSLGLRAGLARGTNPHGLRHQGITRVLDLANGDVWKVKEFSRHAKLETLLRYNQ